jgi:hypothetical protein
MSLLLGGAGLKPLTASGPTTIAQDGFNRAGGPLTNDTADVGGDWASNLAAGAAGVDCTGSNTLEFPGSGTASYVSLSDPSAADVTVSLDLSWSTTPVGSVGVLGRVSGADSTFDCYYGRLNLASDILELYAIVNNTTVGGGTIATSSALGLGSSGSGTIKMTLTGTTIELEWNDGGQISITDSNVTAAGSVGIGQYRGDSLIADDFLATTG